MERTLTILKPDCVQKGLIGTVIKRIEDANFDIIALKMLRLDFHVAELFYEIHRERDFFKRLITR